MYDMIENDNNLFNRLLSMTTRVSGYQKNKHSLDHILSLWVLYNIFKQIQSSFSFRVQKSFHVLYW